MMTHQLNYRFAEKGGRIFCQAYCPVCGIPKTVQKDKRRLENTSLGQHMINAHDSQIDHVRSVVAEAEKYFRRERSLKKERDAIERIEAEKRRQDQERERKEFDALRSKAVVVMTAADIDDITGMISSLIRMMEPYYSQGNGHKDAEDLSARLETKLNEAAHSLGKRIALPVGDDQK